MTQITIMLMVPDRARADMVLRDDRIYYNFATESTADQGDLPGLKDRFTVIANRILEALEPQPGETAVTPDDIKVSVFVDNVVRPVTPTNAAIRRLIDQLTTIDEAFAFLQGFA